MVLPGKQHITLNFTWKSNQAGFLRDMISMSSLVTNAEAYTIGEDTKAIKLAFDGDVPDHTFALYQNKPNPWNGQTSIGFVLPQDADAVLTVYDIAGKEVFSKKGSYKAGYNSIIVSEKELPFAGILYYKIESGAYAASKKMILVR